MKSTVAWHFAAILLVFGAGRASFARDVSSPDTRVFGRMPAMEMVGARILPAWKNPVPISLNAGDDYRSQYPQYYAITEPPDRAFKSFVEWDDRQAIVLTYPGNLDTGITNEMVDMVVKGIDAIPFWIVSNSASNEDDFLDRLSSAGVPSSYLDPTSRDVRIRFFRYSLDSIWTIDFGPFPILADGELAFVDFKYYSDRAYDDAIPTALGLDLGINTYRAPMYFEGGNYASDGKGTCWVSQGAYWYNTDMEESEVDAILYQYMGCRKIIVLEPLEDGTTHIDMFAKLVNETTLVLGKGDSANCTTQTVRTLENDADILAAATTYEGESLTVHRIPMPYQLDGSYGGTWRSYTNSTFANGVNLIPVYPESAAKQAEAMAVWQQAMPDWEHVGVTATTLISWGGAMHCISRGIANADSVKWVADGDCVGGTCDGPEDGYSGECGSDDDCTGPGWICDTNDCTEPVSCGEIGYTGCCDGSISRWCEEDSLQMVNCGTDSCGWDSANGFYECGFSGEDPTGASPIECPGACVPSCYARDCGDDGCGGSCGECDDGWVCSVGVCEPAVVEPSPDVIEQADVVQGDNGDRQDHDSVSNDGVVGDSSVCVPFCPVGRCGPDGCGGQCSACPDGTYCGTGGTCVSTGIGVDAGGDSAVSQADVIGVNPIPVSSDDGCAAGPGSQGSVGFWWLLLLVVPAIFRRLFYTTGRE